ncbi:MAG: PEP-CTERM sorting domain-containing protein [Planctomycetota bacterium]
MIRPFIRLNRRRIARRVGVPSVGTPASGEGVLRPLVCGLCCLLASSVLAGPYSGPTDTSHPLDPAIALDDPLILGFADAIDPTRTAFAPRGSTSIDPVGFNSLGDLSADDIANGVDPGVLTVTFPLGIANATGPDFAVFENGFVFPTDPFLFIELAFVEVSTNGTDFARFPAVSTNTQQSNTFGTAFVGYDVTNIHNLAGKHADGFGTPFDLDDLIADPLVVAGDIDLGNIQYVRLVDIPGNGSRVDSLGNPIFDNWLTTGTGGFDFRLPQGVAVLNRPLFDANAPALPEPASAALLLAGLSIVSVVRRRRSASLITASPGGVA